MRWKGDKRLTYYCSEFCFLDPLPSLHRFGTAVDDDDDDNDDDMMMIALAGGNEYHRTYLLYICMRQIFLFLTLRFVVSFVFVCYV